MMRPNPELPLTFEQIDAEVQKGLQSDLRGFSCEMYPPEQTRWVVVFAGARPADFSVAARCEQLLEIGTGEP